MMSNEFEKALDAFLEGADADEAHQAKNLRESDLRKKVNRLRRKAVPIASSREGYFYASNAAELYSTIRQLKEMRAGLDAAICGLEQAMETFTEPSDGGGRDR